MTAAARAHGAIPGRAPRVGIFGGAFDPPHASHVKLAQDAIGELELDRLIVVPTGQAWHKTRSLSGAEHRVAMTELAFAGIAGVLVERNETLREGPSYTFDTLWEISRREPSAKLFLLIGEDQAQALAGWHRCPELLSLATICVASRNGSAATAAGPFEFERWAQARVLRLHCRLEPISATEIRSRVARGQGVVPLVSEAVARYIDQHHLYQTA